MTDDMRILHVFDHSIPLHSGYTFRSRSILRAQHARGWQTVHITGGKHDSNGDVELVEGMKFYRSPKSKLWSRLPLLNQWDIVRQLEKRLVDVINIEKPDIIHAHSPCLNGLAAAKVARKFNIPLVYEVRAFWEDAAVDHGTTTENSLRYRVTRALETRVFRSADQVTCICEGLRKDIVLRGIPKEKITVIPNAVDIEKFDVIEKKNSELEQALGLTGKVVLGFLGSFYAYEGLELLLRAVAQIRETHADIHVLLVGGGPQDAQLKSLAAQLNLQDKVLFTGRVPHSDVNAYYSLVDVLVYPRNQMRLTDLVTPLKPLEAMAQKKLVLASDVGGHQELIQHGKNGYLFKADSVDDLSRALIQVIAQRAAWPEILENGRQYVERERNWTNSVARYEQVYQQAQLNLKARQR